LEKGSNSRRERNIYLSCEKGQSQAAKAKYKKTIGENEVFEAKEHHDGLTVAFSYRSYSGLYLHYTKRLLGGAHLLNSKERKMGKKRGGILLPVERVI